VKEEVGDKDASIEKRRIIIVEEYIWRMKLR